MHITSVYIPDGSCGFVCHSPEILWFQKMTGHVWLDEDGDLCGRDLDETRTPQRYGFTTFEAVIKALHLTPPCEVA